MQDGSLSIGEVIQRVQSLYSKGVESSATRLADRHVYSKLLSVRATLFSQKATARRKIGNWNYQTLSCVGFEIAPLQECPCLPPVGCKILKSVLQIPSFVTSYNGNLIESVTSTDGEIIFDAITWKEKRVKRANKLTAAKPDYYVRNGHFYITSPKTTKIATISGIPYDPIEFHRFPAYCEEDQDCSGEDCIDCISNYDLDFPIDGDMITPLIQLTVQELTVFVGMKEDRTVDSKDSNNEESK